MICVAVMCVISALVGFGYGWLVGASATEDAWADRMNRRHIEDILARIEKKETK